MGESSADAVAVIGMACRLPGGVDSPDSLWESVVGGRDLITEIPADRWNVDEYYDPERGVPGRSVSRYGGFLDDVAGFDHAFFGIGEREAAAMDPQHRLLLETAWEAVEHAGLAPSSLAGSLTGVYVGLSHDDYAIVTDDAGVLDDPYSFTGLPLSMASGRIAYTMGLRGPALTLDAACSSGLLAVHQAVRSLQHGDSDLALAGGCLVMLSPAITSSASAQGMLSPSGRCRPFDVGADGFVRSEGCGVLLLKRVTDARRDGNRILAVIRGTAANQDGRSETITTPSLQAQTDVYRAALAASGVDPATIRVVEAHGTGTPVGDPLEFAGLAEVYGKNGTSCAVASVKSNVGHAESAAGAIGLIKAVMSLRHGLVPRVLHFTELPDEMQRIDTGLFIPSEVTPWPGGPDLHPRRSAVSSFGMSGTNVHLILEEAPDGFAQTDEPTATGPGGEGAALVFPLSATSSEGLRESSARMAEWLQHNGDGVEMADLGYTLARRRAHRPVRTSLIAADIEELGDRLREFAETELALPARVGQDDRGPVWIFSGHGSQWAAMGAVLLATEPVFAKTVAELEPLIIAEGGFSITAAMTSLEPLVLFEEVQPTIFAMQVALAETMRSYGVRPGAVVGHSMGEVAAAVVAGALSPLDGVRLICRRAILCRRIAGTGLMASVELPMAEVTEELRTLGITDTMVAVVASPQSTVIGGMPESVRRLVAIWEGRDVMAREVAVDVASHTPHVDPIIPDLIEQLADLTPLRPTVPYYSATLTDPRAAELLDVDYWVTNTRQPVQFEGAVRALLEDGYRVFGELSPHPLLIRAVEQTSLAVDVPVQAVPCMRRRQELPHGLRGFLGELHNAGAAVDFSRLYPDGRLVDVPLPPWTHPQLMIGPPGDRQGGQRGSMVRVHPLLGAHVRLPERPQRDAWQGQVGTDALPWLADHQVSNVAALPGAAYCEMALTAARDTLGERSEVRDVQLEQILLLDNATTVVSVAAQTKPGDFTFTIETNEDGERSRRAAARLVAAEDEPEPPTRDLSTLLAQHPDRIDGTVVRDLFAARNIQFGPAFTGLTAVYTGADSTTLLAEVMLPSRTRAQAGSYGIHPALLDACFQSVVVPLIGDDTGPALLLPLGMRRLRSYGSSRVVRYCLARVISSEHGAVEADLELLDENGVVALRIDGLRMASRGAADQDRVLAERLMAVDWHKRELLTSAADSNITNWLVVATGDDSATLASQLTAALAAGGAPCRIFRWLQDADHEAAAVELCAQPADAVVVVCPPPPDAVDEGSVTRGREQVRHLVRIAREVPAMRGTTPRLYVLTRNAQAVRPGDGLNLDQGGVRGLLRVIGAEHPELRATQIDLDAETDATRVAAELLSGSNEDETAWRAGESYAARLTAAPLRPADRRLVDVDPRTDGMRLQVRVPGDLETLEFVAFDRTPPAAGQVEVAVTASSVNFADVLVALGRYPSFDGKPQSLGVDFAGVVTAVGTGVTEHRVGDRVAGFCTAGCWSTFVTCDARLAVPLPPGLTDEQAAAATTAYGTAWYGMHTLARVDAGDRVLIHSATGGVGQAAMAIARNAGAEIFATAGSSGRRAQLRDMGIEHVYDSRSLDFAEQIQADTDGYGVDIVLNSLTGPAQSAGLELLSIGGRFIEIGKRDVYSNTRLGLYPFRRNLEFYVIDLALMCNSQPKKAQDLLREVYRMVGDGTLEPLQHTRYPLADAATAIRAMSSAQHTGKLVLAVPTDRQSDVAVPPEHAHAYRRDGSYILTGGLGGLGLCVAAHMAAGGAGRIVLTSRSLPSPQVIETIERMRAAGAEIHVECGDISDAITAGRLVDAATNTGLPLRGILHAAGVVEDATLTSITDGLIDRDWAPKVFGAWHLHNAAAGHPLDWFCSFSSVAALLGSPGQGPYAAANSWLDAFSQWRRSRGLPATSIAWGAWAEIGRGAGLAVRGDTEMITPAAGVYAFHGVLSHDRTYCGYTPPEGSPWLTALIARSPFAEEFTDDDGGTKSESTDLRTELQSMPTEEWPNRLRRLLTEQVSLILRCNIDPDGLFADYGLDSLGNLELRTHIETGTGIRINPRAIVTHNTARALARHLAETLESERVA